MSTKHKPSRLTNVKPRTSFKTGPNCQVFHRVVSQADMFSDTPALDTQVDVSELQIIGKPGYSEAKQLVQNMINSGYEDLDILIKLGEEFDRELVERLVVDLRRKGIL